MEEIREIRLEVLKLAAGIASRQAMQAPQIIVEMATTFEHYIGARASVAEKKFSLTRSKRNEDNVL